MDSGVCDLWKLKGPGCLDFWGSGCFVAFRKKLPEQVWSPGAVPCLPRTPTLPAGLGVLRLPGRHGCRGGAGDHFPALHCIPLS